MLQTAGAVIVTCCDERLMGDFPAEFFTDSCAAATENMLLAAHSMGLGGVWLGVCEGSEFYMQFCNLIGLPPHLRVTSMIALGNPAEEKEFTKRFDPAKWVQERFQYSI